MQKQKFDKYLTDRYLKEIKWYDTKSLNNQWWYKTINIYVIIASASIPILITFLNPSEVSVKIIISLISSSIVIATGINNIYKFQENWINYRTTAETLKKEKSFYVADIDSYGTVDDKEKEFVQRVESIISRENSLWLNTQNKDKENTK